MFCTSCGAKLPEQAKFCPECGKPVPSGTSIRTDQDVGTVKGEVVGAVIDQDAVPSGLDVSATQEIDTVGDGGTAVGVVWGDEDSHVHVGGQQQYGDRHEIDIDTGGGAFVGARVDTGGGAFVGRDQVIGLGGEDVAGLFAAVYQKIEARPQDPNVDKEELTETVERIEREVAKGEGANASKVERWLGSLAGMAPDILDVTVACLTGPATGIATVIRKIAVKAKEEARPA